jgi:hypothetical protein
VKFSCLVATASLAAALSQPAAAKEPLVLEPSSHWELDYAKDSCALRRMFGEGEQQTQIEMRRFQPDLTLQTTVATKAAKMTKRKYRFRFGTEEWSDVENPLYAYLSDDFEGVIFLHSLVDAGIAQDAEPEEWGQFYIENDIAALEAEAGAKVQTLTISRAFRSDLLLKTGPLKQPLTALNQCIDELMSHWSIDVEAHKTRSRSATPVDFTGAASMVGYPPKMLRRGLPGLVNVRLDISETGRVMACHIQMPLSDPEFEESSCADIQHAFDFEPALDKDGKPMKSYYVNRVRFQISGAF